jgi:hypothetical protein
VKYLRGKKMAFLPKKKKEVPTPPKIKRVSTYEGPAEVKFEKKEEEAKAPQAAEAKKMTPREVWKILPAKHKILTAIVVIIVIGTFAGFFAFLPLFRHVEEISPVKEVPPSEKVTTPEEVTPAVKIEDASMRRGNPESDRYENDCRWEYGRWVGTKKLVSCTCWVELSGTVTLPVYDPYNPTKGFYSYFVVAGPYKKDTPYKEGELAGYVLDLSCPEWGQTYNQCVRPSSNLPPTVKWTATYDNPFWFESSVDNGTLTFVAHIIGGYDKPGGSVLAQDAVTLTACCPLGSSFSCP